MKPFTRHVRKLICTTVIVAGASFAMTAASSALPNCAAGYHWGWLGHGNRYGCVSNGSGGGAWWNVERKRRPARDKRDR